MLVLRAFARIGKIAAFAATAKGGGLKNGRQTTLKKIVITVSFHNKTVAAIRKQRYLIEKISYVKCGNLPQVINFGIQNEPRSSEFGCAPRW